MDSKLHGTAVQRLFIFFECVYCSACVCTSNIGLAKQVAAHGGPVINMDY